MNKNFNIVWNTARNMYVVASEHAQGDSQIKAQARAVGITTLLGLISGPAMADYTPTVEVGKSVSQETLNTGNYQDVYGSAFNTTIEGGVQRVMDGGLSQDAQVTGGFLEVEENGTSVNSVLSGKGAQYVYGTAEHTTINSGAINVVSGTAVDSVINADGKEYVYGLSTGTTINNKGMQIVAGATVEESTVNQGGTLVLRSHDDGIDVVSVASNTTVNSGGSLWLESDHGILEGTTLIKTGATINALTGVITNSGLLDYDLDAGDSRTENNSIQGSGSLQKTGQGTLLLTGNSTYSGDTLVDEGTLWLADSAVIGTPAVSGSSSQLMNGTVSVAAGATLGGTGVINDDVSNTGNIAISQSNETGHTLTINGDYTGNNGTLSLNTQLGDDASPTDKLLITGDTAGTTTVFVTNTGGAGALTTKGIEVIDVGGQSDGIFT